MEEKPMNACKMSGMQDLPQILSVRKIWDRAPHNAFTALVRFKNQWWCTFREAADHGRSIGTVRVIFSEDGECWESIAVIQEQNVDLRDPKLSVMPDGRLMLVAGGIVYEKTEYRTRSPRVAFSADGYTWTTPQKVLGEDHWLWRVTWHKGRAYSVSKLGEGNHPRRAFLYFSADGIDWQWIAEFILPNNAWDASETTLRFMPDDEMIALIRPGYLGSSRLPYKKWTFHQMEHRIGGPNFIRLPENGLWAAGRSYHPEGKATTVLAKMTRNSYVPVLQLPSGGGCSYPGLVWHNHLLWMSYYSSHEGKACIYLAQIQFRP